MKNKITVIFSSHYNEINNNIFKQHISNTIGCKHEINCIKNFNEYSLSEIYNKFLENNKDINNILLFCHNDILIKTKNWGRILLNKFNNTNYGIIGVAGTTFLSNSGVWWEDISKTYGIVDHTDDIKDWTTTFSKPIEKN